MHMFLKLFIVVKPSTCFGKFSVCHQELKKATQQQACVKQLLLPAASRDKMSPLAAGNISCLTYAFAVCAVSSPWWWTERPSEMFRALYKNN